MQVGAGVEEEVDDRRRGTDQERRQPRDQHGPPPDHRLLEVLGVDAQGPGGGADEQAGQRGDEGPGPEAVGQVLQGPPARAAR